MSKLARPVTPDEVAAYRHAGVVLLRGVIDLAAVNTLRRAIDEAVSEMPETAAGLYRPENAGTRGFVFAAGIAARLRDFKRFVLSGPGPEISAKLLNSEKVHFFGDEIFVKEPGTAARTAFHQDATYFEIEGDQCCVLWIPTDPVTIENGAMLYWRGSHKSGKLYQPNVFVSQAPLPGAQGELLPDIEGNLDKYDIVHFDVEPGDVIVHHYRTVHGAGGNMSRYQVRRAASLRYCGDDIRFQTRPWTPRQLHHTARLNDGDPLGGPDFPVVWRRHPDQQAA
jgi:ectoine hydroxylase-related dioxygenase (phytanoyl-CoA dioxygenase family)